MTIEEICNNYNLNKEIIEELMISVQVHGNTDIRGNKLTWEEVFNCCSMDHHGEVYIYNALSHEDKKLSFHERVNLKKQIQKELIKIIEEEI